MKRVNAFVGLAISMAGVFLLINSTSRITGFAVLEGIGGSASFLAGILLLIVGIIIFSSSKKIYSLREAAERGKIGSYISGKEMVFKTGRGIDEYSKHVGYVGRNISDAEILKKVGSNSQFLPIHSIDDIHEFERRVALKGKGHKSEGNAVRVYGVSVLGPSGVSNHKFVAGLAVDLEEIGKRIYIHSHPISEGDIPGNFRKKREKLGSLRENFVKEYFIL